MHLNSVISEVEGSVGNFKSTIQNNGDGKQVSHGVVIVATGAEQYEPTEYLYGKNSRVVTQRTFEEIVHYATLTPVNAVVLHVKSPKGKLMWPSENPMAVQMGVGARHSGLEKHVARLKKDNIHTIAKPNPAPFIIPKPCNTRHS